MGMPPADGKRREFRADIQGLRAIAILSVVIFHARPDLLPGGFLGVDIFFVISGYLITGILIRRIDAGTFTLRDFYTRRVVRLFPALFAMLAATLAVGCAILPPEDLVLLGRSLPYAAGFLSNIYFAGFAGYFSPRVELQPLLHTWSLAIEEQFYIAFPLSLLIVSKIAPKWRKLAIAAAFLVSLAFAVVMAWRGADMFYHSIARAYELMVGALIAVGLVPAFRHRWQARVALLTGLGLIALSLVLIDGASPIPGWRALLPCLGCGFAILAGRDHDLGLQAVLVNPVALFFGAISYALYLWHWPILVYARYLTGGLMSVPVIIACVALAIVLATLSTYVLERPILRRTWRARVVLPIGLGLIGGAFLLGTMLVQQRGVPHRFDAATLALFADAQDYSPFREACHYGGTEPWSYAQRCRIGGERTPAIAVWGDSFGVELAAAVAQSQGASGRQVLPLTGSSCPPSARPSGATPMLCARFVEAVLAGLRSDRAVDTVVLTAKYTADYPFWSPEDLVAAARVLQASGKRVYIVLPIPTYEVPVPATVGIAQRTGRDPATIGIDRALFAARTAEARETILRAAQGFPVTLIDPAPLLCDGPRCRIYDRAAGALYFDGKHLSMAGARLLVAGTALADLGRDATGSPGSGAAPPRR